MTIDRELDVEKDHLVFTRRKDGMLNTFRWYSAAQITDETMKDRVEKANQKNQEDKDGFVYELITDKLAREICAYREYARPLEDLIDLVKDAKQSIGNTIQAIRDAGEYLNDAERMLDKIEGVD